MSVRKASSITQYLISTLARLLHFIFVFLSWFLCSLRVHANAKSASSLALQPKRFGWIGTWNWYKIVCFLYCCIELDGVLLMKLNLNYFIIARCFCRFLESGQPLIRFPLIKWYAACACKNGKKKLKKIIMHRYRIIVPCICWVCMPCVYVFKSAGRTFIVSHQLKCDSTAQRLHKVLFPLCRVCDTGYKRINGVHGLVREAAILQRPPPQQGIKITRLQFCRL